MSKKINLLLIFVAISSIVIFLVLAGISPVFAAEETEAAVESNEGTIQSAIDWIKSLSADQIKGWIGAAIAFLSASAGSIILLVIKIAYDSVKRTKREAERKKEQTAADKKIIEVCNNFLETEESSQAKIIEAMRDFAKQYDIKLKDEVTKSVEEQKKVLDKYADKIKELENQE